MIDLREALRVKPGSRVRVERRDPSATFGWDKPSAEPAIAKRLDRLTELQTRVWAESRHAVLVILQGIDASGKDGTINKVMEAFNPQGCPVTGFKVPSSEELAHDYLWRVHKAVPRKGEIGIFNRSTTRTCWSSVSTTSCRARSGVAATTRSTRSRRC